MTTILRDIGPLAALSAIRASVRTTPLSAMPPTDPWLGTADTILMRTVPLFDLPPPVGWR